MNIVMLQSQANIFAKNIVYETNVYQIAHVCEINPSSVVKNPHVITDPVTI
jgi:hypothetical protein